MLHIHPRLPTDLASAPKQASPWTWQTGMADELCCSQEKAGPIHFGAHRAVDKSAQGDTLYRIRNADSVFQCDDRTHLTFGLPSLPYPYPFLAPRPFFSAQPLAPFGAQRTLPRTRPLRKLDHIPRRQNISAGCAAARSK